MTIATLSSSTRLIVFQFLMKDKLIPAIVPVKRPSDTPPLPPVSGQEILRSTPGVDLFALADVVSFKSDYELVDVWRKPHERNWDMSFVRFVYCRKEYVRREDLHPDFVSKRTELTKVLVDFVSQNLWATQAHRNPYYEKDGSATGHSVLMFGCAGRKPNEQVFRDGRDEFNRGKGPKVPLSTLAPWLLLTQNNIALETR